MTTTGSSRALIEVFGHSPTDATKKARTYWQLNACPFVGKSCSKYDHSNTICYGTCSVSNTGQNVVICPNRMYADNYASIQRVSRSVFGDKKFMLFDQYIQQTSKPTEKFDGVVALGQNSGKEVRLSKMSMDWILAHIRNGVLKEYVGIEVQSIDITGNYRDAWYAARDLKKSIPPSGHGLNWANVHKRLIPQIIRKSLIYSKSQLVRQGLFFIVPEPVYQRFEEIIGNDIPLVEKSDKDVITVHTYDLGESVKPGNTRKLIENRTLKFRLDDFSTRFITGSNLPSGEILDSKIRGILACS